MSDGAGQRPTVLVITGPVGAGKTTTADAIFEALIHRDMAVVFYDMDDFRHVHPLPRGDAFAAGLGYRVAAGAWRELQASTFDAPGTPQLAVIADVVETREQRADYERAFAGARVLIVRLDVDPDEVVRRLEQREPEYRIDWYRERTAVLRALMHERGVGDLVLQVHQQTPSQLAEEVLSWLWSLDD